MSESNMNCLTYALQVEGRIGDESPENLEWWKTPLEAVSNFAGQYDLQVRPIEAHQELCPGEWRICFFGWIPVRRDYEHRVVLCDYHLLRQEADGRWVHRETWGSAPQEADLESLTAKYRRCGYEPRYFAVRRSGT